MDGFRLRIHTVILLTFSVVWMQSFFRLSYGLRISPLDGSILWDIDSMAADNDDDNTGSNLNHRILAKSVTPSNDFNYKEENDGQSSVLVKGEAFLQNGKTNEAGEISEPLVTTFNAQVEIENGNKPLTSMDKRQASSSPQQHQHHRESSIETEDKLLQNLLMNTRRDEIRFRVRNSSELHIDNHTEDNTAESGTGKLNSSATNSVIQKVVILHKPFHFHVPIVPKATIEQQSSSPISKGNGIRPPRSQHGDDEDHDNADEEMHSHKASGIDDDSHLSSRQTQHHSMVADTDDKKEEQKVDLDNKSVVDNSENSSSFTFIDKRGIYDSEGAEESNSTVAPEQKLENDKAGGSTNDDGNTEESDDDSLKDLDKLLQKYPELVPSVNRKRNSAKESQKQDLPDDELSHYPLISIPQAPAAASNPEGNGDDASIQEERNVKNVNFSQDFVDSILGHEDDFVTYKKNIKTQSEKLGVDPEEIFHQIVFGNGNGVGFARKKLLDKEIIERQNEFQKLFADEEEFQDGTDIQTSKDANDAKTYNEADQKTQIQTSSNETEVLTRTKRGLKKWLKRVFKRGGDATTSKSSTTPRTTNRPSKIIGGGGRGANLIRAKDNLSTKSRKATNKKIDDQFSVDEKGDTAVDFLLPVALRRSTYLKKQYDYKMRFRKEEEMEAELAKSEEKEQIERNTYERKRRDVSENVDDSYSNLSVLKLRKIPTLYRDEVLIIEEMLLTIVEYKCEKFNRSVVRDVLYHFGEVLDYIVKHSDLADEESKDTGPGKLLFMQMLSCTESLPDMGQALATDSTNIMETFDGHDANEETNISFEEAIRPLRRTKRVRRENTFSWSLNQFMKLHFFFYKLARDTCVSHVHRDLLHDATLILLNECAKAKNFLSEEIHSDMIEPLRTFFNAVKPEGVWYLFEQCTSPNPQVSIVN